MKNVLNSFRVLLVILAVGAISSCSDDDAPDVENDPEMITTAKMTFIPRNGGTTIMVDAVDPDGAGPQAIEVGDIELQMDKIYDMTIEFLNELETPAEDITAEIMEEADEHQIFYESSSTDLFTVTTSDQDASGFPIGLTTVWETKGEGTGTVKVTLKHQPDGIKTATSTVNDGETDLALTFAVFVNP